MARSINDILTLMWYVERKERGTFTTPEQLCMLLNTGQLEVYEDFFSEYGKTQRIHDALNVFKVRTQFTSAFGGIVTLPSDYLHLLPDVYTVTGSTVNPVRFLNEDEWVLAIDNQLRPVSTSAPIAKDFQNGFMLYPASAGLVGFLTYLRLPAVPVFGYSQAGRVITDVYINKIIAKALGYLGINLNEQQITEFGLLKDKET
jgi:hypothetical protein